jgi:hypothetical protein
MLLLAVFGYIIPVHQLYHSHKAEVDSNTYHAQAKIKQYEKPCCKSVQFFKNAILTTSLYHLDVVKAKSIFLLPIADKPLLSLISISNKAPPILG